MHGLKVGHFTDLQRGTGVSVFLFESNAVGSYWMCGSAPATHELATLDAESIATHCHALVLTGGSAYGLPAAAGAMRYLGERGIGHPVPTGVVPIVPAAAIYDLACRTACFPLAEHAYQACESASEDNIERGRIEAGSGATVGKLIPGARCMTGGIGRTQLTQADGLEVIAYVVVNSVGDVYSDTGIIAGARDHQDEFANTEKYLLSGAAGTELFTHTNTALVVVLTNAKLDKAGCRRIARMATAGLARAITPVFTQFDGDIVFSMSLGDKHASELTVGTMAVDAVRLAVLDAVKESEIVNGQRDDPSHYFPS